VRPNSDERPDERTQNKHNIYRRQKVVFESELQRRESKIENEIERERQSHDPWQFAGEGFIKHRAEGSGDDSVKHRPHRPKKPRGRRPERFY